MQIGHPSIVARLSTRIADGTVESASAYWALCAALIALASLPLVLGVYPPFIDYPFHLARIAMLSDWNASAFLREHYDIPSLLLPNLSLELVMLPLSKLMPAEVAGIVFISLMFALILSGTAALHRTLFGMRSLWPFLAAAWLYNWIVFYGFMNYVFGIGVLLWCLTAWLRMAERAWWVRLLAGVCLAVVLFFCHLVAFILYASAIAGYELQGLIMTWRRELRLDWLRVVVGAAQFVPSLILYIAVSPTRSTTTRAFIYDFTGKAASLLVSLTSGNAMVDLLTIALLVLAVAAAIRRATIEIAPRFIGAFIGLAIAFLLAPRAVTHPGPAYVDVRIPIALLFTAIAATRLRFRTPLIARTAVVIFSAYLLIKIAVLSVAAMNHRQLALAHLAAYDRMSAKSTLFAARQRLDDTWFRRFYVDRLTSPHHIYALAAIRREIFVPAVYTVPGGQPIRVRERYQAIKMAQGDEPVEVRDARELEQVIAKFAKLHREASPGQAAYLLMQDRAAVVPLPPTAEVVASGPGFRLAKIVSAQPD
jgi:hypothetical protein